jgi:hypothetical protein
MGRRSASFAGCVATNLREKSVSGTPTKAPSEHFSLRTSMPYEIVFGFSFTRDRPSPAAFCLLARYPRSFSLCAIYRVRLVD